MSKNINIHVKTKGTRQAKKQLDGVGNSAEKTGGSVEKMGSKATRGANWITKALGKIAGPLGFAAIATAVATSAIKVAKFFDVVKARSDEAVREVQGIRTAFMDLFEALDAFDEKSRVAITKSTNLLFQKAGVSQEIGLPIVNAYTRQFKPLVDSGELTQEQYNKGLRGMLGYGERHGGAATKDLIAIMKGWGMITPEQQGEFRRQIAAGAAASGLTDEELIGALGRGMPTIKAMGWTPAQAVETMAVLAAGETGRKKMSLPATTLQGLLAPQLSNVAKYGISEEVAQDPRQLLAQLQLMRGQMDQKAFMTMLTSIYGTEAAAGVSKLISAPRGRIRGALTQAAGPKGITAEQKEEQERMTTLEARDAKAKARARRIKLELTEAQKYMEDVREIGWDKQKQLRRDEPFMQAVREVGTIGAEAEKEDAAFRAWLDSLSPEEKRHIREEHGGQYGIIWRKMALEEKFESLTGQPTTYEIHYHNEIIHNPVVGNKEDRRIGPRSTPPF